MVLEYFLSLFCTAADSGTGGACLENASSTFSFNLKVFIASPQIHMGGGWHGNLDSGINFLSPRGEREREREGRQQLHLSLPSLANMETGSLASIPHSPRHG